jgi:translocation and assembly module TamB
MTKPADASAGRTWLRRAAIAAGIAATVAGVGVSAALIAIQTPAGRAALIGALQDAVPGLTVERLSAGLPLRLSVEGVVYADEDGVIARVARIDAGWSPTALLGGTLHLTHVDIDRPVLARLPESGAADAPDDDAGPGLSPPPFGVRLDRLRIENARIEDFVAGEVIEVSVRSDLTADPGGDAALTFNAERHGAAPAGLTGTIAVDTRTQTLRVDVTATEPQGGAVSALLGLDDRPAGRMTIAGEGPLSDWRGRAEGGFGDSVRADLALALTYGARLGAGVDGTLWADALIPADLRALVSGPVRVSLRADADADLTDAAAGGRFATQALTVRGEASAADINRSVTASLTARLTDPAALAQLSPGLSAAGLAATVSVDGPMTDAPLRVTVAADTAATADVRLHRPRLTLTATPAAGWAGAADGGPVAVDGTFDAAQVAGGAVQGLPFLNNRPVSAALSADAALDGAFLSLTDAALDTPLARMTADAVVDTDSGAVTGSVGLTAPALAAFAPLLGPGVDGRASASAEIDVLNSVRLSAVRAALDDLRLGDPALNALAATGVRAHAERVELTDAGLAIAGLQLTGAGLGVHADVTAADALTGSFSVRAADLSVFSEVAGTPLGGAAALNGTLGGPVADPAVAVALEGWSVTAAGAALPRVSLRADAVGLTDGPRGSVNVDVDGPSGPASLAAQFDAPAYARMAVSDLQVETAGFSASGDVTVDLASVLAEGRFDVRASDLGPAGALAGVSLAGALNGRVRLSHDGARQSAAARLSASGVRTDGASAAALTLDADVALGGAAPRIDAAVSLEDATAGPVSLTEARLTASGPPARLTFDGDLSGRMARPFSARFGGTAAQTDAGTTVSVERLDADLDGTPLSLSAPVVAAFGTGATTVDAALTVGEGTISATVAQDPQRLSASVDARNLPLALSRIAAADPALAGAVDLQADVTLSPDSDAAAATMTGRGLAMKAAGGRAMPPVDVNGGLTLENGIARAAVRVKGPVERPASVEAVVPVRRAEGAAVPTPVGDGPLTASVTWTGDLAEIEPLIPVPGHRLEGRAAVDLEVSGTLDHPAVAGTLSIDDGVYENLLTGTLLTDLTLRADGGADGRLRLTADARDGGAGSLTLNGAVDLDDPAGLRADLDAAADAFRIVRLDEADATLSGPVDVTVVGTGGSVVGDLVLDPVEIRLTNTLPASVTTLDVEETSAGADAAEDAPDPVVMDLDVTVSIPARLFVRGRGLDSEWKGALRIGGTTEAPVVDGGVETVRGQVSAFNKVFKIAKGSVTLDGGADPDPVVDVAATTTANALDITLAVSGRASNPEIAFSSSPPLPRDEVLAQLMFGKRAGALGPAEALALADAVNTLRSGDGGFMDKVRQATGLDVLRASAGEDGPSVTAGKYVGEGVFVGVKQGADPSQSAATVEVDVTDTISVETEAGANADSSIGVNWKIDY